MKAEHAVAQSVARGIGQQRQCGHGGHGAGGSGKSGAQRIGAGAHREESERQPDRCRQRQPRKVQRDGEGGRQNVGRVVVRGRRKIDHLDGTAPGCARVSELRNTAAMDEEIDPRRKQALAREDLGGSGGLAAPKHGYDAASEQSDELGGLHRPAWTGAPTDYETEPGNDRRPDRERRERQQMERLHQRIDRQHGDEYTQHPGRRGRHVGAIHGTQRQQPRRQHDQRQYDHRRQCQRETDRPADPQQAGERQRDNGARRYHALSAREHRDSAR